MSLRSPSVSVLAGDAASPGDPAMDFLRRVRRDLLLGAAALVPFLLIWALVAHLGSLLPLPSLAGTSISGLFETYPLVTTFVGVLVGGIVLLVVGRLASGAVGRSVERLPVLRFVYGAQRELLGSLQEATLSPRAVVLVPSRVDDVLSVAVVTQTVKDSQSGVTYAALYFLGSPNPVGGRAGLIEEDRLIRTDWTPQDALRFVVSGGSVAPTKIRIKGLERGPTEGLPTSAG